MKTKPMFNDVVMLAAVDWKFIAQAQQIFATYFSKYGVNVIYVEPFPHRNPRLNEIGKVLSRFARYIRAFRKTKDTNDNIIENITIITPIILPETNRLFRFLNKKIFLKLVAWKVRKRCSPSPVVQCWTPYESCLEVAKILKPELLVYSCVDDCLAFTNAPRHLEDMEKEFLRVSDLVVVKSDYLADRLRNTRHDLLMRDSAVEFELFRAADRGPVTKVKRLCYFGAISHRLDFSIMQELAAGGYEILLLGPYRATEVKQKELHPNIECRPPVPYEEVPAQLRDVDAILLPYKIDHAFNRGTHLAKMYECFATGKPILSTPLACMLPYGELVYFGRSSSDFLGILAQLDRTENEGKYRGRIELARAHSWPALFQQELDWMNSAIERKRSNG
jgi:hypothetical protein